MSKNLIGMMDELAKSSPDWVQLGLFILKVGDAKTWREIAPTFKSWLETFASKLNVSSASLFKYRAGVEVGMRLNRLHLSDSEESIREALGKTKSDIIETLAKVIPLVPGDLATKLTTEVFEGAMTRSRIRELLRLYKAGPVDCGEALTLGSHAAKLAALAETGVRWLENSQHVSAHKLVPQVHVKTSFGKTVTFDAVLIVKKMEPVRSVELHGLIFDMKCDHSEVQALQEHCNYLWMLGEPGDEPATRQSAGIGRLSFDGKTILQQFKALQLGNQASIAITAHSLLVALL